MGCIGSTQKTQWDSWSDRSSGSCGVPCVSLHTVQAISFQFVEFSLQNSSGTMGKRALDAVLDTTGVRSPQPKARKATSSEEAASGAAAIDQAAHDKAVVEAAPEPQQN